MAQAIKSKAVYSNKTLTELREAAEKAEAAKDYGKLKLINFKLKLFENGVTNRGIDFDTLKKFENNPAFHS